MKYAIPSEIRLHPEFRVIYRISVFIFDWGGYGRFSLEILMKYSWVQFPRYQITRTQHFRKINPEEKLYHRKSTSSPGEKNCHFYRRNLGTFTWRKTFCYFYQKEKNYHEFSWREKNCHFHHKQNLGTSSKEEKNSVMIFITGTCASKF